MTSRKTIKIFYFNGVNVAKHWHGLWRGEVFAISDCLVKYVYIWACIIRKGIDKFNHISDNLDLWEEGLLQTVYLFSMTFGVLFYLAPGGGCEVLFSPCLSVCVCVCLCVCPANILVYYLSAIGRDIYLKFIQDTYRVVLYSLKRINLQMPTVKVTGTIHWFLKVQSYHKNWAIKCFFNDIS